jgi:hypothetical protein
MIYHASSSIVNNQIEVNYSIEEEEHLLKIPNTEYYIFDSQNNGGRIYQTLLEDVQPGLLFARYIVNSCHMDLLNSVIELLNKNVYEIHFYDEISLTLFCIYFETTNDIDNYIINHYSDSKKI